MCNLQTHSSNQLSCTIFHSCIVQCLHTVFAINTGEFGISSFVFNWELKPASKTDWICGILLLSQTFLSFQNHKISDSSCNEIWSTRIFHCQTITPHQDAIIRPSFTLCNKSPSSLNTALGDIFHFVRHHSVQAALSSGHKPLPMTPCCEHGLCPSPGWKSGSS